MKEVDPQIYRILDEKWKHDDAFNRVREDQDDQEDDSSHLNAFNQKDDANHLLSSRLEIFRL